MGQLQNRTKDNRLKLQAELETLLGSQYVYFQPDQNVRLHYPCIVYNQEDSDSGYADDRTYIIHHRYTIVCISKDPDDDLDDRIQMHFEHARSGRPYVVDQLYHKTVSLYY